MEQKRQPREKETKTRTMPVEDSSLELNEPMAIAGTKCQGPTQKISIVESRQRYMTMERLIATAHSDTEIELLMETKYGMDPKAVKSLQYRIFAKWAEESAARNPHLKMAARMRLAKALREATEDRSWTAVANLEKVLSGIEGTTVDPKEVITPTDQRLRESLLAILNEADQKFVIEVIERERTISIRGAENNEPSQIVIDVEGEPKCLP